jgi:predicted metal-dependent phosphoesterase TrpH
MKFDTHIHTKYSPCSNSDPEAVVLKAMDEGLGEIIIKDHDETDGALEAIEFAEDFREIIKVTLGVEITTDVGEIGVSYLTEDEVDELMILECIGEKTRFDEFVEAIYEMREAGSEILVDLHHPFDYTNAKRGFNIKGAIKKGGFKDESELMKFFDFTEMNTASTKLQEMRTAQILAGAHELPIVCSTDSHFIPQIGRYYTETDCDSIREAILQNNLRHSVSPEDVNLLRSKAYRLKSWALKKWRNM